MNVLAYSCFPLAARPHGSKVSLEAIKASDFLANCTADIAKLDNVEYARCAQARLHDGESKHSLVLVAPLCLCAFHPPTNVGCPCAPLPLNRVASVSPTDDALLPPPSPVHGCVYVGCGRVCVCVCVAHGRVAACGHVCGRVATCLCVWP